MDIPAPGDLVKIANRTTGTNAAANNQRKDTKRIGSNASTDVPELFSSLLFPINNDGCWNP